MLSPSIIFIGLAFFSYGSYKMKIKVNRFDPTTLKPHKIWLLLGKRNTGKSTLIRDLMFHMKSYVDYPVAMTPTEESISSFEKIIPESCVHTGFNVNTVDRIIAHQRQRGKKKLSQKNILMVLDDMMYDKKVLKGQGIRDIFMNGRHLKITLVNAMQYCMDMGPDLRSQVDYCFALRENIVANRVKLWKYFFGGFENFDDFCTVLTECTSNNECLVIDNTVKSNNLEDMIFWYKADIDIPPYIMGDRRLWSVHHSYYRPDGEEEAIQKISKSNRITEVDKKITSVEKSPIKKV